MSRHRQHITSRHKHHHHSNHANLHTKPLPIHKIKRWDTPPINKVGYTHEKNYTSSLFISLSICSAAYRTNPAMLRPLSWAARSIFSTSSALNRMLTLRFATFRRWDTPEPQFLLSTFGITIISLLFSSESPTEPDASQHDAKTPCASHRAEQQQHQSPQALLW